MRNITLEVSLKPFKQTNDAYIQSVCNKIFEQWKPLTEQADTVSVLLWASDGSEILEYDKNLEKPFEWAYWVGGANNRGGSHAKADPDGVGLHNSCYKYTDNPPQMTYAVLKKIVQTLKQSLPDQSVRVGATFDPGPEFAKSDFKYKYHNEICGGTAMGAGSMVNAASFLKGDNRCYAAYPNGIPNGTSFGTFFGKQCKHFLADLGFDYIWLSNGLGFGREMWSTKGDLFDGEHFNNESLNKISELVFRFWTDFRAECDFPVETRGTNMSMGIDLATDGVPLKKIYEKVENLLPPPNSPWAALNGDYGLELMGHMSRIAELPDNQYLFRYYLHDPWWANSPWIDRYEGLPHDIYLPLATARIDKTGKVCPPDNLNLLTIDNSYGEMPDSVANEAIPHLIKAMQITPDAPSPLVWIYPFNEYNQNQNLSEMFCGDWFVRNVINAGVPLNTVVSTDNFVATDKALYKGSILLSPVPEKDSLYEQSILQYVNAGGKVIFYGSVTRSSTAFRNLIGVTLTDGVSGELDFYIENEKQKPLKHNSVLSGGAIDTVCTGTTQVLAAAGGKTYATAGENFVWLRATNCGDYNGGSLLHPHARDTYFKAEELVLKALEQLGWQLRFNRLQQNSKAPVSTIHCYNNAFWIATYAADTTVEMQLKTHLGIPIPLGCDVPITNGVGVYRFPRFSQHECRVFIEQQSGMVTAKEYPPVSFQYGRRIHVTGLENATVRLFAEKSAHTLVNGCPYWDTWLVGEAHERRIVHSPQGTYIEISDVTGDIMLSFPR